MTGPTKKIFPPKYFMAGLIAAILLHCILPIMRIIPFPYNFIGVAPVAVGIIMNLWADQLFKRAGTTVKPDQRPAVLIAHGPFAVSRHPMYFGMLSILIGTALLLGSASAFVVPAAFFAAMELSFIPEEEKTMSNVFSNDYAAYKRKVRRWI